MKFLDQKTPSLLLFNEIHPSLPRISWVLKIRWKPCSAARVTWAAGYRADNDRQNARDRFPPIVPTFALCHGKWTGNQEICRAMARAKVERGPSPSSPLVLVPLVPIAFLPGGVPIDRRACILAVSRHRFRNRFSCRAAAHAASTPYFARRGGVFYFIMPASVIGIVSRGSIETDVAVRPTI